LKRHKNLDSTFSQAYSFGTPKHICYILHRLSVSRAQGYDQRLAKELALQAYRRDSFEATAH
jgi:hypothetical protein